MSVARVYNPNTQQWEVVAQGAKGEPGGTTWELITGKPDLSLKADLVGGLVPTSQIPAVALTKPHVVADRAAMLALDAEEGDVAVIASGADKGTYMLGAGAATSFASWVRLSTPDATVSSVNGQTGVVNLTAANVGAAPTSHTHAVGDVTGLQAALDGKAPSSHTHPDLQAALDGKVNTSDVSTNLTNGSIPRRTGSGTINAADPQSPAEVATKGYVDRRPAMWWGAGPLTTTKPGMLVGDTYWNTTTGEVSVIESL